MIPLMLHKNEATSHAKSATIIRRGHSLYKQEHHTHNQEHHSTINSDSTRNANEAASVNRNVLNFAKPLVNAALLMHEMISALVRIS